MYDMEKRHEVEKNIFGMMSVIRDLLHEAYPEEDYLSLTIIDNRIMFTNRNERPVVIDCWEDDDGNIKSLNRTERDGTNFSSIIGHDEKADQIVKEA